MTSGEFIAPSAALLGVVLGFVFSWVRDATTYKRQLAHDRAEHARQLAALKHERLLKCYGDVAQAAQTYFGLTRILLGVEPKRVVGPEADEQLRQMLKEAHDGLERNIALLGLEADSAEVVGLCIALAREYQLYFTRISRNMDGAYDFTKFDDTMEELRKAMQAQLRALETPVLDSHVSKGSPFTSVRNRLRSSRGSVSKP